MDIRILQLIDGAKEAVGLTVIIDVFRAFSLECYLYNKGAECIIPIGNIAETIPFFLKKVMNVMEVSVPYNENGGVLMNFEQCRLEPLNDEYILEISTWQYDVPYEAYSFRHEGYLMNKDTWGTEQFCMIHENIVLAHVACQFDNNNIWVGWSLNPDFCGKGMGKEFVSRCFDEICKIKNYKNGNIYLRVVAWNKRAIKCYEKAGFKYYKTILDEIAGTGKQEDFWVMRKAVSTKRGIVY